MGTHAISFRSNQGITNAPQMGSSGGIFTQIGVCVSLLVTYHCLPSRWLQSPMGRLVTPKYKAQFLNSGLCQQDFPHFDTPQPNQDPNPLPHIPHSSWDVYGCWLGRPDHQTTPSVCNERRGGGPHDVFIRCFWQSHGTFWESWGKVGPHSTAPTAPQTLCREHQNFFFCQGHPNVCDCAFGLW